MIPVIDPILSIAFLALSLFLEFSPYPHPTADEGLTPIYRGAGVSCRLPVSRSQPRHAEQHHVGEQRHTGAQHTTDSHHAVPTPPAHRDPPHPEEMGPAPTTCFSFLEELKE